MSIVYQDARLLLENQVLLLTGMMHLLQIATEGKNMKESERALYFALSEQLQKVNKRLTEI